MLFSRQYTPHTCTVYTFPTRHQYIIVTQSPRVLGRWALAPFLWQLYHSLYNMAWP